MSIHYPRKQTIYIFLFCVIAIAIATYYAQKSGEQYMAQSSQNTAIIDTSTPSSIATSNTDWKKAFVERISTPQIETKSTAAKNLSTATTNQQISNTDKLGREIFSKYAELKQSGNTNSDTATKMVQDLIEQSIINSSGPTIYSISEVKVNQDTSLAVAKQYGNEVGNIMKSNAPSQNEVTLAYQGMQKEDYSFLKVVNANLTAYEKILSQLLALSVPKNLVGYHISMLNGMSSLIFVDSSLSRVESDPLSSLVGLSEYQNSITYLSNGVQGLKDFFTISGISFKSSEGGSYFRLNI